MSIETIIQRATAEHIVVQGREDALRALIIAETTPEGLTNATDYHGVATAAELAGFDRHGLTIVSAPEPDKTQQEPSAAELAPVEEVEPVRTVPVVGDVVQIEFPDVPEFSKPRKVTSIDAQTAFVEFGDPRGYPIEWLKIVDGSGTGRYGDHDNWTQHGDGTDYPTDGASYGVGSEGQKLEPFVPSAEERAAVEPDPTQSTEQVSSGTSTETASSTDASSSLESEAQNAA